MCGFICYPPKSLNSATTPFAPYFLQRSLLRIFPRALRETSDSFRILPQCVNASWEIRVLLFHRLPLLPLSAIPLASKMPMILGTDARNTTTKSDWGRLRKLMMMMGAPKTTHAHTGERFDVSSKSSDSVSQPRELSRQPLI